MTLSRWLVFLSQMEQLSRSIFTMDHDNKLFSDRRFYQITGDGVREIFLDPGNLSKDAKPVQVKLRKIIANMIKPPLALCATRSRFPQELD